MPHVISKKYRPFVIGALVAAILVTMPFMKTQNNMSQLYRPNQKLLQAESLMQDLNGINTSKFLIVRGKTLNDALMISEEIKDESVSKLRRLYSISADEKFKIGSYDVLGTTVTVYYHVGVSGGSPFNEILIVSNLGTATIGNTGVTLSGSWSRTINVFMLQR